jgi:hypothetical protein
MTEWTECDGLPGLFSDPRVRLTVSGLLSGSDVAYMQLTASVETYDVVGQNLRDDLAAQFARAHPEATNVQYDVTVWRY